MLFSILICTLDHRKEYLERIMQALSSQIKEKEDLVEILSETDDGSLSIGSKRNRLLERAQGDYIAFVDDDDVVSSDYVDKILEALQSKPDVVGMHLLHFNDGVLAGFTYHSLRYESWFENRDTNLGFMRYYRNPNHLNPVKREYALQTKFPEISMGEDKDYSYKILKHLKTEEYITEPIYYYLFRRNK
jgi:glycosyltransferase involved in cell wall biosynthesis